MTFFTKFLTKKWWVYCVRWLTSGLVIAPVTSLSIWLNLRIDFWFIHIDPVALGVSLGNVVGAAIYWHFDIWLLCDKPSRWKILNWIKSKLR